MAEKKLSTAKIFYIVFGLVLFGFIVLFSSGAFDNPVVQEIAQQAQTPENQGESPSLANMEEIQKLEQSVSENPNDFESVLRLGHLYNDSGMFDKAIEKYKIYLSSNPNESDVWVDMGVCYYNLKRNDEAISTIEKAIKINPTHQIGLFNLGIINFSAGKMDEAKKYWQKSIDVNPNAEIAGKAKELLKSH
jgi:tetratricopeptide (TPR) repeat protein